MIGGDGGTRRHGLFPRILRILRIRVGYSVGQSVLDSTPLATHQCHGASPCQRLTHLNLSSANRQLRISVCSHPQGAARRSRCFTGACISRRWLIHAGRGSC